MQGLYLYGIVGFPPPLPRPVRGLGGVPVFLVAHAGLAAVVSPSRLGPWPPGEAHLTRHEAVVEAVMDARPILPVRFNTLLRSEEAVVALLAERAPAFQWALRRVEGKVELGLRVLWKPPGEAAARVEQQVGNEGSGTAYLYRRLREEQRRARVHAVGGRLIREVQAPLEALAVESWHERTPRDRLLFTGAYLVERDRLDAFVEGVAKAREEFSRLSFLLTGPWPPYHFVNHGASDEIQDTLGLGKLPGGVRGGDRAAHRGAAEADQR